MTLVVLLLGFVFAGHVAFGANTGFLSLVLAAGLLGLAAFALGVFGVPRLTPLLAITASFFAIVLIAGAFQLAPAPAGLAHPFWEWVEGPGAITMDRDATLRELFKLLGLAAAFVTALIVGQNTPRVRFFFRVLILFAALYAIWAFVDFIADPARVFGVERPFHRDRLAAGFLSANTAATLFGMLAILALAALRRRWGDVRGAGAERLNAMARTSILPALAFLFCVTGLMLSASRAGAFSFLAAILLFLAWEFFAAGRRRRADGGRDYSGLVIGMCGLAVIVLAWSISSELLSTRLERTGDDIDIRTEIFAPHWRAFLAAPWFGNGLGSFAAINNALMDAENWRRLSFQGATHNVFIQWLEEAGVFGAGAMFASIAALSGAMLGGLRRRARMRVWLRAILCASIVPVAHGLFDYALQVYSVAAFWTVLLGVGCGIAAARPAKA